MSAPAQRARIAGCRGTGKSGAAFPAITAISRKEKGAVKHVATTGGINHRIDRKGRLMKMFSFPGHKPASVGTVSNSGN